MDWNLIKGKREGHGTDLGRQKRVFRRGSVGD